MLLLNINRKGYMGSPMTLSNLTLSDLERSNLMSLRFRTRSNHQLNAGVKQDAKVHGPLVEI